jgi:hypothetical protein
MRAPHSVAVAIVTCFTLCASSARAVDADRAKELFDRGVVDLEAGRYDTACPAIEESYKLDPRPGTLFTLASCQEKWGRIATALRRYDEYLAAYAALSPDKKAKQGDREQVSRAQKAELAKKVPELTLALPPNVPAGTRVTRDGVALEPNELGVPLRVDPGDHVIVTQAPGAPASTVHVTMAAGERKGIALVVPSPEAAAPIAAPPPPPPAAPPPPPSAPPPNVRLIAGATTLGVGIVFGVVGLASALQVKSAQSTVDAQRTTIAEPTSFDWCSPATAASHGLTDACSKIKTFEPLQFASFGIAAVAGGVGIALLVLSKPSERRAGRWNVYPAVGSRFGGASASVAF